MENEPHSSSTLLCESRLPDFLFLLPQLLLFLPFLSVFLLVGTKRSQIGLILLLPQHLGLVPLLPESLNQQFYCYETFRFKGNIEAT